jgi:outer membrane murein-binding lipoprotein Lpp
MKFVTIIAMMMLTVGCASKGDLAALSGRVDALEAQHKAFEADHEALKSNQEALRPNLVSRALDWIEHSPKSK